MLLLKKIMFFMAENVEQSHVVIIMLLKFTKSLVLCYYTETSLNPARGNALKKSFVQNFLVPTHAQFVLMGHTLSFFGKGGNNCSDKQRKNTEEQ